MNSQLFLIINISAAVLFTFWFLLGRKSKNGPVQLNLREKEEPANRGTPMPFLDFDKESSELTENLPERDVTRSQLKLKTIDTSKPLGPEDAKALASAVYNRKFTGYESWTKSQPKSNTSEVKGGNLQPSLTRSTRDLNVMFIYNGHDWDAYKVIGVPPGSSLVKVTEAYQQLIRNMDKDALPFVEAAYRTILESAKKRKVH